MMSTAIHRLSQKRFWIRRKAGQVAEAIVAAQIVAGTNGRTIQDEKKSIAPSARMARTIRVRSRERTFMGGEIRGISIRINWTSFSGVGSGGCTRRGLNPQPSVSKTDALSN